MTLADFIAQVRAGTLLVHGGEREGDTLLETMELLDATDLDGVTAAAFDLEVLDSKTVSWEQGRRLVGAAMPPPAPPCT